MQGNIYGDASMRGISCTLVSTGCGLRQLDWPKENGEPLSHYFFFVSRTRLAIDSLTTSAA